MTALTIYIIWPLFYNKILILLEIEGSVLAALTVTTDFSTFVNNSGDVRPAVIGKCELQPYI